MRTLLLLLFFSTFLPASRASQQADAAKTYAFPSITSYSLDKEKVNLPSDFQGKVNLLLISFEPEQAKDIDTWMPTAQALQHTNFDFRYYKVPVSNQENALYRWWDSSSLRGVETDPELWPWIIPLYINKDEFRHSLGIPDEKAIVCMLVDKSGRVLWRITGPYSQDKKNALTAAVTAATQH